MSFHSGTPSMFCAPFKTRSLRFEWEATILTLTRPLIAKNAMNGAQRLTVYGDPLAGPPAFGP